MAGGGNRQPDKFTRNVAAEDVSETMLDIERNTGKQDELPEEEK